MVELTFDEGRVLGVLVEKAFTTPDQYPLTLNAIVNGANQKNNRDPVVTMTEDAAFEAVEGLKAKGLAVQVDQVGARVSKYKHRAPETLHVTGAFLAVLTELILRGPQTLGELRGRASRMGEVESLEKAAEVVRALIERDEPYVRRQPPVPGSRAEMYVQLIATGGHQAPTSATESGPAQAPVVTGAGLADRVTKLEAEVIGLREKLMKLAGKLGETEI
jgi:uncharacterized protein YceH (UPF0502 family)